MNDTAKEPRWYAVHTRSRHEKKVDTMLRGKVAESFLPLVEVQSRRRDRRKFYQKVLIPGYLFINDRLTPDLHLEVLKTPGVVKVLKHKIGSEDIPCPIPDEQIDSLKILLASRAEITPFTYLQVGERVEVVSGPFMGAVGELVRLEPNRNRLVVTIDIVNQSVAVEIDVADVEKLE
jgi:transcription antitermination factor NusG